MKKIVHILCAAFILFMGVSCLSNDKYEAVLNTTAPQPPVVTDIISIPGGAVVKYNLPKDEDLLCVKAEYYLKEQEKSEQRASMYSDSIVLKGFNTLDPQKVTLIAVNRSNVESSPVNIEITPDEAPVVTISKSLEYKADFGGMAFRWENPTKAEIAILVENQNEEGKWETLETFYSATATGKSSVRGMDTLAVNVRVSVRDHWDNRSDFKEQVVRPIYEAQIDRTKMKCLKLPSDAPNAYGGVEENLFDDDLYTYFHSPAGYGKWPLFLTIDLGATVKLSRFKAYERSLADLHFIFGHGNPRVFEVYGKNEYKTMEDMSTWDKITDCVAVKPSGLPIGQYNDDDVAAIGNGDEFLIDSDIPAYRYIRFKFIETWSKGDFVHWMELKFYGTTVDN